MDEARPAVCEICGSGKFREAMFNCTRCNAYRHGYCLEVLDFQMRDDWCCSECQKEANGDPKPIHGKGEKTEFQRPLHGSGLTNTMGSKAQMPDNSHRNMAHQIGVKTPQIYENFKVKFIPCEEAALLSREKPAAHYTRRFVARRPHSQVHTVSPQSMMCISPSRQVHPASPQSMKCMSPIRQLRPASPPNMMCMSPSRQVHSPSPPSMKCMSPSRQVSLASPPNMKCISPSRQVHPASPPSMKCMSPSRQVRPAFLPNMKCISPTRQVHPASPPSMMGMSPSRQVRPASPPSMKCISPSRQVRPASPPSMKCISPSRQVRPASPQNLKPSSSMKCILPSRQVRPASPRSVKQSCNMRCVSPSRSDNQAFALKRCAVATQNLIKVDDIKMTPKVQSGATPLVPHNTKIKVKKNDHQLQDQPKEEKVASAHKGKCNSWQDDQPTGESALNASVPTDAHIGCGSGTKSLHNYIDKPVTISSCAAYARRPPPEAIWTGCFLLSDGESYNLGQFKAYLPSVVSSRVCNITKKMPNDIQLKILPRMNYWPESFEERSPVYNDIALLFFSAELDCGNKKHPRLLETHCNFVMKAYIDDMMLLIYSSEVLPPDSQWIDGENYLWGVFVKPKAKTNPALLGSVAA